MASRGHELTVLPRQVEINENYKSKYDLIKGSGNQKSFEPHFERNSDKKSVNMRLQAVRLHEQLYIGLVADSRST